MGRAAMIAHSFIIILYAFNYPPVPRRGSQRSRAGFRKFSKEKKSCIARTRRASAGLTVYPPWIQIGDVARHLDLLNLVLNLVCHDEV
jgi:hypothetical protein